MKEYLLALMTVCIVAGIVRVIASGDALAGYVELICAACVLLSVIVPIFELFSDNFEIGGIFEGIEAERGEYEEIFDSYVEEMDLKNAEISLSSMLEKALSLKEGSTDVRIALDNSGKDTVIKAVTVILYADAVGASPQSIREYVMQYTDVECEIVYDLL